MPAVRSCHRRTACTKQSCFHRQEVWGTAQRNIRRCLRGVRMLLGHPDVKADTWVNRFAHRASGDSTLRPDHVRRLVTAAAALLPGDISATVLNHAIWRSSSGSGERRPPAPSPCTHRRPGR